MRILLEGSALLEFATFSYSYIRFPKFRSLANRVGLGLLLATSAIFIGCVGTLLIALASSPA